MSASSAPHYSVTAPSIQDQKTLPPIILAFRDTAKKNTIFVMGEKLELDVIIGVMNENNLIEPIKIKHWYHGLHMGSDQDRSYVRLYLQPNKWGYESLGRNLNNQAYYTCTHEKSALSLPKENDDLQSPSLEDSLKHDEIIATELSQSEIKKLHEMITIAKRKKDADSVARISQIGMHGIKLSPPNSSIPPNEVISRPCVFK